MGYIDFELDKCTGDLHLNFLKGVLENTADVQKT